MAPKRRKKKTHSISNSNSNSNPKHKSSSPRLVKYEELPEYLQDNEYIVDHYRAEWPLRHVLLSVFMCHNETLNVWTHLVGFLFFFAMTLLRSIDAGEIFAAPLFTRIINGSSDADILGSSLQDSLVSRATFAEDWKVPRWPRLVFMFGAMTCLACSSISHLLACHSRRFNLFFWRLDYTGISIMIVSSFFPPICYVFYCHPTYCIVYLSTISTLGLLATTTLLFPVFTSPRFRPFRAYLFLAMGCSGVIPAAHALVIHREHFACHVALGLEIMMGLSYAAGAIVYVGRVPERWKPGAFDLAGQSHQIFHVFVLIGAILHYAAIEILLDWRDGQSCNLPTLQF